MAQIQKGTTFADGQLVTGARLNQLVDSAILNPEVIGDQTYAGVKTVNGSDELIMKQASTGLLKKITVNDLLQSSLSVTTNSIDSTAETFLPIYNLFGAINISANKHITIQASDGGLNGGVGLELVSTTTNSDIKITATGNDVVINSDALSITPRTTFSTTSSIKIPVGTTAQRPSSAVVGDFRYNSTTSTTEIYDGSAWGAVSTQPRTYVRTGSVTPSAGTEFTVWTSPILTIPTDETWIYRVNVSTNSGYVTGSTRPDVNALRFRMYSGTTQIFEEYGSCSPYGAHTGSWNFSTSLTSANNGYALSAKFLASVSLDPNVYYIVTLHKVKTSSLSDASSCI